MDKCFDSVDEKELDYVNESKDAAKDNDLGKYKLNITPPSISSDDPSEDTRNSQSKSPQLLNTNEDDDHTGEYDGISGADSEDSGANNDNSGETAEVHRSKNSSSLSGKMIITTLTYI